MRPRHPRKVRLIHLDRTELGAHQLSNVSIQPATVRQALLQPVEATLPPLHAGVRTAAMLQEKEASARVEDAMELAQASLDLVNAAQGKGADHGIEDRGFEGQSFRADLVIIQLDCAAA